MKTTIISIAISLISITAFSQVRGGGQPVSEQHTAGFGSGSNNTNNYSNNSGNYDQPIRVTPVPNPTPIKQQPSSSDKANQPMTQPLDANKGNCTGTATEVDITYVCPKCGYTSKVELRCPRDSTLLVRRESIIKLDKHR